MGVVEVGGRANVSFLIFVLVVSCGVWVSQQLALPYGCKECQQKGGAYCWVSSSYQFCSSSADSCLSQALTNRIISDCTGYGSCADKNYDCAGCLASGCSPCAAAGGVYCKPSTDYCDGTKLSTCTASAALTCSGYSSCSVCVADSSCSWCSTPTRQGCILTSKCPLGATKDCTSTLAVCPLLSNTYQNRCNCTSVNGCYLCYGYDDVNNLRCAPNPQAYGGSSPCKAQTADCNAPEVACQGLINSFDPYGTRCGCLTNPSCSICLTKPPNEFSDPSLACVSTASPPSGLCQTLTRNCVDPEILCPTKLTCGDCTASPSCSWCESTDISATPKCIASTQTCSGSRVKTTTCSTCFTKSTCTDCNSAGCKSCASDVTGSAKCLNQCNTAVNSQKVITDCKLIDRCSTYTNCGACKAVNGCNWCESNYKFTGENFGAYCTSVAKCGNDPTCGVATPCTASVISDCVNGQAPCSKYTDCLSCTGQSNVNYRCYWCDINGVRSCNFGCSPGAQVSSCAVFGPTTTGLPVISGGQTGTVSTGASGYSGVTPSPSSGTVTGGSSSTGSTTSGSSTGSTPSGGSTGNTPSGGSTGNTPSGGSTGNTPSGGGTGNTPSGGSTGTTPSGSSTGTTPSGGSTGATSSGGSTGATSSGGSTGATSSGGSTGTTPSGGSTGTTPSGGSTGTTPSGGSTGSTPSGSSPGTTPSSTSTGGGTPASNVEGGGGNSQSAPDWTAIGIGIAVAVIVIIIIVIIVIVIVKKKQDGEVA